MNRVRVKRWRDRHIDVVRARARERYKRHYRGIGPTKQTWRGMLDRCRRVTHIGWHRYGGRGITVCERWLSYENFLLDMGERPVGHTIHRIDNDKGYEPGNCKWATQTEQKAASKANHPHGMSPRQYERRLAANKRYRQRNPEKFRQYKKMARLRKKNSKTADPTGELSYGPVEGVDTCYDDRRTQSNKPNAPGALPLAREGRGGHRGIDLDPAGGDGGGAFEVLSLEERRRRFDSLRAAYGQRPSLGRVVVEGFE